MNQTADTDTQQLLDEKFMGLAIIEAKKAEQINEIPVGAVVVCDGKVIAQGYNQSIALNDPSAHAEMLAIRLAGQVKQNYRLLDCTLYVTLEPCPMCAGLLVHSRINRLVFGAKDLKTGSAESVFNLVDNEKLNHQIPTTTNVLSKQCSTLLSDFFKRRRKEKKQAKKQPAPVSTTVATAHKAYQFMPYDRKYSESLLTWFTTRESMATWGGPGVQFPSDKKTFELEIKIDELSSYCLVDNHNALIAFGQYYQRLNHCHLGRLAVNPNFRNQGIAQSFIEELERQGKKELQCSSTSLFVLAHNANARRLYGKLGYVEQDYPEPLPIKNCLYMIKNK